MYNYDNKRHPIGGEAELAPETVQTLFSIASLAIYERGLYALEV